MFPQIFAAEGATFDLILKTAAGATVRTYDDVPSLGPEANTLIRDFLTGGRFQVTGNAGTIRMAFGSASPDDTGGAAELTGWDGTQLETLRLHSDVTTISGALRTEGQSYLALEDRLTVEGGLELQGVVLATGDFSAVSTVDLALSADYDIVEVEIADLRGSFTQLFARLSYDNGSTFKDQSGDYTNLDISGDASSAASGSAGGGTTGVQVANQSTSTGGLRGYCRVTIVTTSESSVASTIVSDSFGNAKRFLGAGHGKTTYGRATHVRFYPNTSTASGRYRVVGKKGW